MIEAIVETIAEPHDEEQALRTRPAAEPTSAPGGGTDVWLSLTVAR